MLFVGHLINENKQSLTTKSYLSAIRAVLKQDHIKLQEDEFLGSSLTHTCRLQNDRLKLRLPIQKGMLGIIVRQVGYIFEVKQNQPYLSLLYQTLFTVAYYGLFHIGELTASTHVVKAKDIYIGENKEKI